MAFPDSVFLPDAIVDGVVSGTTVLDTTDVHKAALYLSSFAGTVTEETEQGTYDAGIWLNDRSAGNPITLTSPTFAPSSGILAWKSTNDDLEWTGLDETNRGLLLYNDSLSPKRGYLIINFGADRLVAGSLTVTPDPTYGWGAMLY